MFIFLKYFLYIYWLKSKSLNKNKKMFFFDKLVIILIFIIDSLYNIYLFFLNKLKNKTLKAKINCFKC